MSFEDDILRRYGRELDEEGEELETFSREYEIFRDEAINRVDGWYEGWCNFAERIITIKAKEEEREELERAIEIAHLNINVDGGSSLAVFVAFLLIFIGLVIALVSWVFGELMLFLPLLLVLLGAVLIKPLGKFPLYLANKWRLKASNQMVLCILYVVIYMRHTSNLERAIKFASEHIGDPLALDFRKIFWDVETGRFSTINESLDYYLMQWKDHSLEFVESFNLIKGSLYEGNEEKRLGLLDKALDVMLEGTYDKMLHFAHNLKSPITMLHMLGIILPILGLVLFPLIGSFLRGLVKWWHLLILYDVILPIMVLAIGLNILGKRPTGHGETSINMEERVSFFPSFLIIMIFMLIGLSPIILHYISPELNQVGFLEDSFIGGKFLDYKCNEECHGPYGIFALILSLSIPLGLALGLSMYFKMRSSRLMQIREETKKLEQEFSGSLFQLANSIGTGIPAELAFEKVAETMEGTASGNFFRTVAINLRQMGMSLEEAIFGERGALQYFPSGLIESSMRVLVEGARKGSIVVANSLFAISKYVDRIHKIDERLRDLLADIVSSMTSQIKFLTPMIAGIVVGVSSMVVAIINKLGEGFSQLELEQGASAGGLVGLADILNIEQVIPGYHFQIVVGLFVIEIIIVLTILSDAIQNGMDKISREVNLAKNLVLGVGLYVVISFIGILVFNVLANTISFVATTS